MRDQQAEFVDLGPLAAPRAVDQTGRRIDVVGRQLGAHELGADEDLMGVGRGALAEQLVGQHLLYSGPSWEPPQLYYWMREKQGSAAEVDYLLAQGAEILPVEVKAGKTGRLKSLHLFLREKHRRYAIRLGSGPPSLLDATTALPDGENVPFRLLSLPLYLVGEVRRLAAQLIAAGERDIDSALAIDPMSEKEKT
ncbi:MAG: DUF4143 domain-containing protein [Thermoanaerobaculia bacterium]|nr:DUF4143 domain-containing protein [Thermoanaerobaculia bacterium]